MRCRLAALILAALTLDAHANPPAEDLPPDAYADRWIGVRVGGGACPTAPGWAVTAPFAEWVAPGAELLGAACAYRWVDQGPADPASLPPEAGRDDWLTRQTWAIRPQSSDLSDHLVAALHDNWRAGSGSASLTALPPPSGAITPPLVAVIDSCTAAGGCPDGGATRHGYLVKQIIENLTHPSGPIDLAEVITERALGSVFDGLETRDIVDGGAFGTHLDLAMAIVRAVWAWQTAGVDRPLIINLSLGWQTKYGAQDMAGPARVPNAAFVAAALRYARCHGALVFAASGNRTLDDDDTGMLLPAGWTEIDAPTGGSCATVVGGPLFGPAWVPIDPAVSGPLLYAVTASNAQGDLLGTVRPASAANFRAPGAQVVTEDGGAFNGAFSGASAATAVVSGAAAVLWAYRPDLSAAEIAEQLFVTGTPRGVAYRGATGGGGTYSMYSSVSIDLCQALHAACGAGAAACPASLPACSPLPSAAGPLDAPIDDWADGVTWEDEIDARLASVDMSCDVAVYDGATLTTTDCPLDTPTQAAEAQVWPQPVLPLCDTCAWVDGDALLKTRGDLPDNLEQPKLTIIDKAGTVKSSVDLAKFGLLVLVAGKSYRIKSPVLLGKGESVVLEGRVTYGGKSVALAEDLETLE